MKRTWICALIVALVSTGVRARASGAELQTSKSGISAPTSPSQSRETRKAKPEKKAKGQEKALKLPPVTVEAARIVPQRLQTDKEARETLDRTPGGVGLVTQEQIERRRASTLADVLDLVPGVIAGTKEGADEESQISIRGSGLENTFQLWGLNLLQDGFALNQADGFAELQPIDLDFVSRIEVYKGANALRFGGNTLGGAINLVSKTGYNTPLLETDTLGGSFGSLKNYIGSGRVVGPWDYYIGLSDTELGGYRQHNNIAQRRAFLSAGYLAQDGTTVRVDANYTHDDEKLPGELTLAQLESDPQQAQASFLAQRAWRRYDFLRTNVTITKPLAENQLLEFYSQFVWDDLDHSLPFAILQGSTYDWSSELRYVSTASLSEHRNNFSAGIQYGGTLHKDLEFVNQAGHLMSDLRDQQDHALTAGLYAEDDFSLTPKLTLVAGGRMDYSRRSIVGFSSTNLADATGGTDFFSGISPKLGFIYQLAPQTQLFGNVSRAYQPPILLEETQLVNPASGISSLDAEKAWQFELGTRGALGERINWDLSVYDYEIWDELQNVNVVPFPHATFTIPAYDNIGRTRHTGVELGSEVVIANDLARALGLGARGDSLKARVAYTFSYFRFVDNPTFHSNQIPGITPEQYLHGEVVYSHASGFWLEPYVDSAMTHWAVNSANIVFAPSYVLVGVRAGFDIQPLRARVFFDARNLTNATWVSAVAPDSGLGQFFDPGDGRAFYGGVRFSL